MHPPFRPGAALTALQACSTGGQRALVASVKANQTLGIAFIHATMISTVTLAGKSFPVANGTTQPGNDQT